MMYHELLFHCYLSRNTLWTNALFVFYQSFGGHIVKIKDDGKVQMLDDGLPLTNEEGYFIQLGDIGQGQHQWSYDLL